MPIPHPLPLAPSPGHLGCCLATVARVTQALSVALVVRATVLLGYDVVTVGSRPATRYTIRVVSQMRLADPGPLSIIALLGRRHAMMACALEWAPCMLSAAPAPYRNPRTARHATRA